MAYVVTDTRIGVQEIDVTETTASAAVPLGTVLQAADPDLGCGEFIYLEGLASTAVGSWVTYNATDYSSTLLAGGAIAPVAVSMSANVADQYGWYQIGGKAVGLAATGYADNALVYATATAGTVDDAVVAGDRVKLAKGASAVDTPATGFAYFEIHRPWMDDASAS